MQRWGEPRLTRDVDLTLITGFGNEENFIHVLLKQFASRVEKADEFAIKNRVLLLLSSEGIGMDIALGGLPFEESAVRRSSEFNFLPNVSIRTCSAEDLVVFKTFANRPQDWIDIEGVLVRQGDKLNWKYIIRELKLLLTLKEVPEILDRLNRLRKDCK